MSYLHIHTERGKSRRWASDEITLEECLLLTLVRLGPSAGPFDSTIGSIEQNYVNGRFITIKSKYRLRSITHM